MSFLHINTMTTLHCIHEGESLHTNNRLKRLALACKDRMIQCIHHNSLSENFCNITKLQPNDLMYNVTRGSLFLESFYINSPSTTFYVKKPLHATSDIDASSLAIMHQSIGLSVPKTIFHNTSDRKLLLQYANELCGFPIVLKVVGGTLGIGTMLVTNSASLFSLADYLVASGALFIIRQYIEPREVARLIVVGHRVVASNQKLIADGDFRTTVKNKLPIPKEYSIEAQQLAITATHAANRETGGVDILFDNEYKPYLLEVNMPHDFVTTEEVTGIDIAGCMVDHLISKSEI